VVASRLEAWTCVLDVFLGPAHAFAAAARASVAQVVVILKNLENSMTSDAALLVAYRTLYWFQQATYMYMEDVQSGRAAVVPNFSSLILHHLRMRSFNMLPELPTSWVGPVPESKTKTSKDRDTTGDTSRKAITNLHPPMEQMRRFQGSGHRSIKPLTDAAPTWVCPQVGGQDICLAWFLKGSCYSTCARKASHQRTNETTKTALTGLLDLAGVAGGQA
jgi:hypothetical protein